MPRLVRIALTLFITATVLLSITGLRLRQIQLSLQETGQEVMAQGDQQFVLVGVIISGILASAGFILLLIAIARLIRRKRPGT